MVKISKFFGGQSEQGCDNSGNPDLSDSPYTNYFNHVKSASFNSSLNDLDDFKTPVAFNKVSKLSRGKKQSTKYVQKKSKRTVQMSLQDFFESNLQNVDVNPDHLQLALALSESTYEAEHSEEQELGFQEKNESFRKALEKYGFGYSKTKVSVESKREPPKNKKSRYKYITPILKIRTQEERETLITSKVSFILAQNSRNTAKNIVTEKEPTLFCRSLQKYVKAKICKLNHLSIDELNNDNNVFDVFGLNIEIASTRCGSLLKNWRYIPGREPTPEPEIITSGVSKLMNDSVQNLPLKKRNDNDCESISTNANLNETVSKKKFAVAYPELSPNSRIHKIESPVLTKRQNKPENLQNNKTSSYFSEEEKFRYQLIDSEIGTTGQDFIASFRDDTLIVGPPRSFLLSPILNSDLDKIKNSRKNTSGDSSPRDALSPMRSIKNSSLRSISPDLFDSDEDCQTSISKKKKFENTPIMNFSRIFPNSDIKEEIECYDLTQSDDEEETELKSFHLRLSDPLDAYNQTSHLNVTEYVNNLLNSQKAGNSKNNIEKISTREDESHLSQESQDTVYINDEELNYSSLYNSFHCQNKVDYNLSEDEMFEMASEEQIASKAEEKNEISKQMINALFETEDISKCIQQKNQVENLSSLYSRNSSKTEQKQNEEAKENHQIEHLSLGYGSESKIELESTQSRNSDDPHQSTADIVPHRLRDVSFEISSVRNQTIAEEKENKARHYNDYFFLKDGHIPLEDRIHFKSKQKQLEIIDSVQPVCKDSLDVHSTQTETPNKSENPNFVIKTTNITPMLNYDQMDTPKIVKELDKFGIKPLKRQKGAKLLKYIYETTHPTVQDSEGKVLKKRRTRLEYPNNRDVIIGDVGKEEDLIFERVYSKKIASCRVPLHIVWYNFVMSNPKIRENILLYEPLQLEVLHSMIKDQGYKFNIQDLLVFLDKKCITIRTAQGPNHGKK